jgi:hypothetical protein
VSKQTESWDDNLPDPNSWTPRIPNTTNLSQGLQLSCRVVQQRLIAEASAEMRFNIDNFDSGAGVEDLARRELLRLLPKRYDIVPGVVNDADGRTAGDCDLVIANRDWAPFVKVGATQGSRRQHIPIEAVYSIVEVKQSASYSALDQAMKKLVCAGRLERGHNLYGHITENQHIKDLDKPNCILNPLFTVAFIARPSASVAFEDLAKRFFRINSAVASSTGRDSLVKMLCVLDGGVAYYSVRGDNGPLNADFCRDRQHELIETTVSTPEDAFYMFYILLLGHLTRSVLNVVGISNKYGSIESLPRSYHGNLAVE